MDPKVSKNDSVVIDLAPEEKQQQKKEPTTAFRDMKIVMNFAAKYKRRLTHSFKFGLALLLVSLLYMLEVVHDRLGDNAMWAIMTVVVVIEFTAGATLNKGLNRLVGTLLGCGLGSSVALLAQEIGGIGKPIIVGISVFAFGSAATYSRTIPVIKKRYDYAVIIFNLTFSLIAISGVRVDEIIKIASDRMSAICLGFAVCIITSISILPEWAGDELHNLLASRFHHLSALIEECKEGYINGGKPQTEDNRSRCLAMLSSKSSDEALANFAKWEPWHGRFGLYYPWNKYLAVAEQLRDLASLNLSLKECIPSKSQASPLHSCGIMKEQQEEACTILATILRELGDNFSTMKRSHKDLISSNLQTVKFEVCSAAISNTNIKIVNHIDVLEGLTGSSFLLLLIKILEKLEKIVKEVDELQNEACFFHG